MIDLNTILIVSLAILAFVSIILLTVLVPIAIQFSRTLNSLQCFLDVVNDEVTPTVKEVKQSVYGVKNLLHKGSNIVNYSLTEARTLALASVHGFVSGFKNYLSTCKTDESSYNGNGNSNVQY